MPRLSRKESYTGFYHVIIRGVGKQIVIPESLCDNGDRVTVGTVPMPFS